MLEQELAQLATAIREAVTKAKGSNSITTHRSVRVRRRDWSLSYLEDPEFANFAPERIEGHTWDWSDQQRLQGTVLKNLEIYKSLVSALGERAHLVEDFVRAVCFASYHGLDDKELGERATALGRQLDGKPFSVNVTAFIDGLSICESPLVISDAFTLRKPTPEDLAEYVELDEYGGFSFPRDHTFFRAIGDFTFHVVNTGSAQRDFLRMVGALCLFRVGGIAANRFAMRAGHPFSYGAGVFFQPGRPSRFTYTLSSSDTAALNKFLDDIAPLLPDPFVLDKVAAEREIAYTRYVDALFHEGRPERAITSAITALEALFLEEGGQQELSHRLAQRVSVILRVLGAQPDAQSTYGNVKKAYQIRSKFIHGGSLKGEARSQADSSAPVLLGYVRECALAFFQMMTPKAELLRQLDRAMIDLEGVKQLEDSLKPVVHK